MTFDYGRWYFGWKWSNGRSWLYPFNWLEKRYRYWGRQDLFHDGPLPTYGLWFFNISWCWR